MKILVHLNAIGLRPGGGYLSMLALAEWLQGRGHDVHVLGNRGKPVDGFRCTIGPTRELFAWADVVLTQLAAAPTAIRHTRAAGKPLVHYVHNEGQLDGVEREDCALAIFNSAHLRDGAAWPGVQAVLHPIVRPDRYRVDHTGDAVLFVNPSESKGSATVRTLAERMPHRRFIVVAGRMSQVGEWPANIEALPATWDMRPIYDRTRVVLMPSAVETWGRVAIEAACSGIPTIAAPTPGLREALGTAGHFLDRDDVDAWQREIERLDDAHVYRVAGDAARARAAELDAIISAQLKEVERQLVELRPPAPVTSPARPHRERGVVDFFASARHYLDHLAPTWHALPPERRGRFVVTTEAAAAAKRHGIHAVVTSEPRSVLARERGAVVVASDANMRVARNAHRPVILCSHGIGQTYVGVEHSSQAGGPGRDGVVLFLHPGEHPAARDRARYPNARVEVVGCPKLDAWTDVPVKERDDPPTIAISFHWGSRLAPEASGTFAHFRSALSELVKRWRVLGHGHPKALDAYADEYRRLGIEVVPEFDEVMRRADLYVCDGISTLYEFAYTGRPVVVLNGPGYRRDVEHGLRFWECADVGVQCWSPAELPAAIELALKDPPEVREARRVALSKVYTHRGDAAERAAAAIVRLLEDGVPEALPFRMPMSVQRWRRWGWSRAARIEATP